MREAESCAAGFGDSDDEIEGSDGVACDDKPRGLMAFLRDFPREGEQRIPRASRRTKLSAFRISNRYSVPRLELGKGPRRC